MRTGLALDDLGDLIEQPIVAVLATYRKDGSILLSPVWYEWQGGSFNVWVGGANEGKARHVAADPRASLVIHEQTLPYRGVEVSGRATLSEEGFFDVVRRTAARYYGPDQADAFVGMFLKPGLVIRLAPDKIRAWDFQDDLDAAADRKRRSGEVEQSS
jgi:PPOX class probable F420-dependent enzyme